MRFVFALLMGFIEVYRVIVFQCSCNEAVVKLDLAGDCDSTCVIFSLLQITHTRYYSSNNNEIKITHESYGHIKRLTVCHSTAEWGSKQTNRKSNFFYHMIPNQQILKTSVTSDKSG